ncbi:MAG: hypothetical protein R8F63_03130 [Acidimicrobiales bacterium]|nr:hypothetical protein [Acidimicrobiales bacterium]
MATSSDVPVTTDDEPSLTGIRIAAALGLVGGIAAVAVAFTITWWFGLIALFLAPAIPMGFVLATEAARRGH